MALIGSYTSVILAVIAIQRLGMRWDGVEGALSDIREGMLSYDLGRRWNYD